MFEDLSEPTHSVVTGGRHFQIRKDSSGVRYMCLPHDKLTHPEHPIRIPMLEFEEQLFEQQRDESVVYAVKSVSFVWSKPDMLEVQVIDEDGVTVIRAGDTEIRFSRPKGETHFTVADLSDLAGLQEKGLLEHLVSNNRVPFDLKLVTQSSH